MAKTRNWTEILIRRGVIGPDQLKESQRVGGAVEDSPVKLGYAEAEDIMKAKAEQHGLPFIELREIEIRLRSSSWFRSRWPARTSSCRWLKATVPSR